jgi:serine/threonine protein kinase
MSEKQIISLLIPICKGLQHLHKKGIAHRDFKVENILLMNGVPKLCDFGSASIERVDLAKVPKAQLYSYEETF